MKKSDKTQLLYCIKLKDVGVIYSTFETSRKGAINKFCKNSNKSWSKHKKTGYYSARVAVTEI